MRSLAAKLTLAFLLVGLTGAMLVAVITRQRIRDAFDQFILNREQQILANNLVRFYQDNGSWEGVTEISTAILETVPHPLEGPRDFRRDWERFTLVGPDRTVLFSSLPDQVGEQISGRELNRGVALKADGKTIGWLLLAPARRNWMPNSPEGLFLLNVNSASLLSALVAAALALFLGGLLALTMTRSLRELTDATVEIAKGKLGRQVKVRSKDELGKLAASFNQMSQDLAQATQARRQMTADIAHELRSPLSVISGYAEALSDGKLPGTPEIFTILHQESQHLSRLVDDLRTLSLADAGELPLNRQPVNPQSILARVAARHTVAMKQKNISLRVEPPDQELPAVMVDVERMAQVFDNLIINAFRYTPQGGEIVLSAHTSNGKVQLQVQDNGSGIAPEDIPNIFNRFYRGDKSRHHSGGHQSNESGLGLAIAKSIVEAHHGAMRVDSRPGQGSTFTILLPRLVEE